MKLIKPCYKYKNSYLKSIRNIGFHINFYRPNESFYKMIKRLNNRSKGIGLSRNDVKSNFYWIVVNKDIVGYIDMRLEDSKLGHVGYMIFEKYRNKGYATLALSLVIRKYKKLGLKKIYILCLENNISSINVIRKNNGILVEEIKNYDNNNSLLKFEVKSI